MKKQCVVIGGGAAGFFAAIKCAEENLDTQVILLEQTQKVLSKVKISGGGRCNVTHSCFDPALFVKNYPRGSKELLGSFTRFQPRDTIEWFRDRGVELKTEADGRMFPVTDSSQTIIDCLMQAAEQSGVDIRLGSKVITIAKNQNGFDIHLKTGENLVADRLVMTTGSSVAGHELIKKLGHTIVNPVPSLFTFNIPESSLHSLAGVSVERVSVTLPEFRANQIGPLLITHFGFSGPAVLKLSAFCARELFDCGYNTTCLIDWLPDINIESLRGLILEQKQQKGQKVITGDPIVKLPKQLWKALVLSSGCDDKLRWINLSKAQIEGLLQAFKKDRYEIKGKTTFKQEFVTCGGVKLSEVDFKTMESKLVPGLFFAGEVLDIDGITGGFNFQAAWTTGWLVGVNS